MITYDHIRLQNRVKELEAKLAGEQQQKQPEMHEIIGNVLNEEREAAELQNALDNQESENPARRTAARIKIAIHDNETE
jgi:hypothetical protein